MAIGNRRAGRISFKVDGTLYEAKGNFSYNLGLDVRAAIIGADVATKAASVELVFVDRFNGSLVITGDVAAVEAALHSVMQVLCDMMGYSPAPMTKT